MNIPTNDQLAAFERLLIEAKIQHWQAADLFSPRWWFLLALFMLPWVLWWRLADKTRLCHIVLYGAFILILSSYMDTVGSELALWQHNTMLIPFWSRLVSADFAVLPVTYMLLYQYFVPWSEFCAALTVMYIIFAFILEPALAKMGIYQPNSWSHWYSLGIYVTMGLAIKLLTNKFPSGERKP